MNRKIFQKHNFLYVTLFLSLSSCTVSGQYSKSIPAVESTVFCRSDSTNTYELYIPERTSSQQKLPLLLILDAHGSGKFALNRFKDAANQYPAVLVASNIVKNGFEGYDGAIQTLIQDVRRSYPVGQTVFVTGFSGGARMALGYALAHPVNGLILCGALAGADQIHAVHCPVLSICGMDDFNFMETASYLFQEQSIPGNLKIELTDASHSWPDSLMLTNAFGFLFFSCQTAEGTSFSKALLQQYCRHQQARIDSLKQHGDFLKAVLVGRNMATTDPFNSDEALVAIYRELKSSSDYIGQLSRLETSLDFEKSVRQPYIEAFYTKNALWWKKEIQMTEERIRTEKDSYTKDLYLRIKGFWGIVSYSLCKQAVKDKNVEVLDQVLPIYRMLEPENPDMWYFSAFPDLWKQKNDAVVALLQRALKAGFSDVKQLRMDFPKEITSKVL